MKQNKFIISLLIGVFLINPLGSSIDCAVDEVVGQEKGEGKISLDLKNVDIVELLRIISLKTGKTIVPGKDVTGRITVYLSNVEFNDVLDIILLTQGLALNIKNNVYYVMTEVEYKRIFGIDYVDQRKIQTVKLTYAKPSVILAALSQLKSDVGKIVVDESTGTIILIDISEKLELLKKTIKDLDRPLTTTIYDLNYIKAADAKTQFTAAITPGTGEVIIDERSGKAFISDLPEKMQKMDMLVRELDEASRQVYVEADIVELTLSDEFERGVNWEKVFSAAIADGLTMAGYFPAADLSVLGAPAYQRISVGTLDSSKYSGILNFLSTYGKTRVISQPRIAVVNNEEANVMVGVREAYITQTQSQATSTTVTSEAVEFIDVGVKLKIVPKIGADGFITMKIKPEVSSVKETIETALGSRIPIVQTSQSETVVKVKDGMMIMIAGMTKIEDTDTIKGWPILSKIPFLSVLFSYRKTDKTRTEVIIFLTPHLSSGEAGLRGNEITEIIPMEYLSDQLQKRVVRDKAIDQGLFNPAKIHDEVIKKEAIEIAAQETARRAADRAAGNVADKVAKKEADEAAKAAVKAKADLDRATKQAEKIDKISEKKNQQAVKNAMHKEIEKPVVKTAKEYYQQGLRDQAESKNKEAIENFIKATQLDKKYAAAYNSLGIAYEKENRPEKAQEMYLKAIGADKKFTAAYSNLALLNEDRNDFNKALEFWRKRALYGDPSDPWTKQAYKRINELEEN